jgi:hypothetical protein
LFKYIFGSMPPSDIIIKMESEQVSSLQEQKKKLKILLAKLWGESKLEPSPMATTETVLTRTYSPEIEVTRTVIMKESENDCWLKKIIEGPFDTLEAMIEAERFSYIKLAKFKIAIEPDSLTIENYNQTNYLAYEVSTKVTGMKRLNEINDREIAKKIAKQILHVYNVLIKKKLLMGSISSNSFVLTPEMHPKLYDLSLSCLYSENYTLSIAHMALSDNYFSPPELRVPRTLSTKYRFDKYEFFLLGSTILRMFTECSWDIIAWD